MHFYTMTIIEDTESEYKSELKLWENTDGKIWIQVGYDDNDPISTQGITLTPDDAKALINELTRLIKQIDTPLPIIPAEIPSTGQQLTLQKVNWNK